MNGRRLRRALLVTACALQLVATTGCGFMANLAGACDTRECQRRSPYYRGVYMDVQFWRQLSDPGLAPAQRGVGYLITAVDFPVTATLDTLVVPFIAIAPKDEPPKRPPILQQLAPTSDPRRDDAQPDG